MCFCVQYDLVKWQNIVRAEEEVEIFKGFRLRETPLVSHDVSKPSYQLQRCFRSG